MLLWFVKKKKKRVFRRKFFKKKTFILPNILYCKSFYFIKKQNIFTNIVKKILTMYKGYLDDRFCTYRYFGNPYQNIKFGRKNFFIIISQKSQNIKCTLVDLKTINTFTTGTILKYFNICLNKHLRRDTKGTKMLLNFIRLLLEKRYTHNLQKNTVLFSVVGFNYGMLILKKNIRDLILSIKSSDQEIFNFFKIKIPFTKRKEKRFKSIKKRLKKNILSNFLKKVKLKLF